MVQSIEQAPATVEFFSAHQGDDPRIDVFLSKLASQFKDNREVLAAGDAHRIVVESSFANPNPGQLVQTNLTRAEARIDFAEFLSQNLPVNEGLNSTTFPDYIEAFIEHRRSDKSETNTLYRKASPDAIRDAIFTAGDQLIESFSANLENDGLVVNLPKIPLLERFDVPLVDLEHAVDAFVTFNSSPQGERVQQLSTSLTEQVIAFGAYRIGKNIDDNPAVMRELLEFAK